MQKRNRWSQWRFQTFKSSQCSTRVSSRGPDASDRAKTITDYRFSILFGADHRVRNNCRGVVQRTYRSRWCDDDDHDENVVHAWTDDCEEHPKGLECAADLQGEADSCVLDLWTWLVLLIQQYSMNVETRRSNTSTSSGELWSRSRLSTFLRFEEEVVETIPLDVVEHSMDVKLIPLEYMSERIVV